MIDYFCSIHGAEGNPDCAECWEFLQRLTHDTNASLVMDEETKLHMKLAKVKERRLNETGPTAIATDAEMLDLYNELEKLKK